jgi:short subunit fatty acids transporter
VELASPEPLPSLGPDAGKGLLVSAGEFSYQLVSKMKTLLSWGFFLGFAALLAAGVALAVNGKGMAVMVISFLVYTGLFIKLGCLPSSH